MWRLLKYLWVVVVVIAVPATAAAHDIPNDVVVQALFRPDGQRAHLLLRVPLGALREAQVPRSPSGFLDIAKADQPLRDAATVWLARYIHIFEEERSLPEPRVIAALASLPSDESFREYRSAYDHVTGSRLPEDTELYWEQAMLDVLLDVDIASPKSRFSLQSDLGRLGVHVALALRSVTPDGGERAFVIHEDTGKVRLDPRWYQAASLFVRDGVLHILSGVDHLLFLLALVIPLRQFRAIAGVISAFTVAHSITLIASAYGLTPSPLWFGPAVETVIAASIVFTCIDNVVALSWRRRWVVAFVFGLVHGFGFSFALRENLQFSGSHVLMSLVSFNVGVELGQLLVLAVLIPLLHAVFHLGVHERAAIAVFSLITGHTAWHWMTDRGSQLAAFPLNSLIHVDRPSTVLWGLCAAALLGFIIWLMTSPFQSIHGRVVAPPSDIVIQ